MGRPGAERGGRGDEPGSEGQGLGGSAVCGRPGVGWPRGQCGVQEAWGGAARGERSLCC